MEQGKILIGIMIIEQTKKLIEELNLQEDSYYSESPYINRNKEKEEGSWNKECEVGAKWRSHVSPGFYGFDLGSPVPVVWIEAIDKFLDLVKEIDPEFTIQQIKVKYGGIRIYISSTKEVYEAIDLLDKVLFDEWLIY